MKQRHKILFVTVVPSPYQRDLFGALAARDEIDLSVCYMEAASPDSPWPEQPLRPFERVLPGSWIPIRNARAHVNWALPDVSVFDMVVVSTFTSLTGQWLMRYKLRSKRWLFWGERLWPHVGLKGLTQARLAAPISTARAVVGVGRAAQQDYRRRFPHLPHFSIPYHCDLSPFFAIPRDDEPTRPTTFLLCGQMIARKGVDLLLSAFDRLIRDGLSARLLLVGREADLPVFLERVTAAARAEIRYEGFQAPERLAEYFAQSDVFVLPSRHDGWGVVVNQGLAAGLPIITSDAVGAGLELVENSVNGLQVAAGDVGALYRSMKLLAENPALAREWGRASRRAAVDLTPEAGAEKWIRIFDALLDDDKEHRPASGRPGLICVPDSQTTESPATGSDQGGGRRLSGERTWPRLP